MVTITPANAGDVRDMDSVPGLGMCAGVWQPTPVFLPGEPHGRRNLVSYGTYKELAMTSVKISANNKAIQQQIYFPIIYIF